MFFFAETFMHFIIILAIISSLQAQINIQGCYIERSTLLCYEANHTKLPEIPINQYTQNLIGIAVHNRNIQCLPDNIYKNINVPYLDLSTNQIELISNKTFSKISLTHLILRYNRIKTIDFIFGADSDPEACLNMGKKLKTIDFRNNEIAYLRNGSFDCLKKIQSILLPANNLSLIETGTFSKLSTLTSIDLSFNYLNNIDFLFENNVGLFSLILNGNSIFINRTSPFRQLSLLNTLNLDSNNLNVIYPENLKGLTRLVSLGLSSNNISTIDIDSFSSLR